MSEKFKMDSEGIELEPAKETRPIKKPVRMSPPLDPDVIVNDIETMSAPTFLGLMHNSMEHGKRFKFMLPKMMVNVFEDTRPITFVETIREGDQRAISLNAGRSNERCNFKDVYQQLEEEINDWRFLHSRGVTGITPNSFIPIVVQYSAISIAPIWSYHLDHRTDLFSLRPHEISITTGPTLLNVTLDPSMRRSARLIPFANAGRPSIPDSPRVS